MFVFVVVVFVVWLRTVDLLNQRQRRKVTSLD
jgi:hypothetical protein